MGPSWILVALDLLSDGQRLYEHLFDGIQKPTALTPSRPYVSMVWDVSDPSDFFRLFILMMSNVGEFSPQL